MKVLTAFNGIALVLGVGLLLGPAPEARGATITADGTTCTFSDAILTANTNVNIGGCARVGSKGIADTIELIYDVTLTTKDLAAGEEEDEEKGPNGLPAIKAHITINAHGHIIERDPALFADGSPDDPCSGSGEKFRVFQVGYPGGNLTLNDAVVRYGCSIEFGGGALLFEGHHLVLNRVTIANNRAVMGGGILAHESTTEVTDSTLIENSAVAGGGIYARTGTVRFTNSTLTQNTATGGSGNVCVESLYITSCLPKGSGGAIALNAGRTIVTDSTISGNAAVSGGGLYNGGATASLTRATLTQNTATNGGVIFNEHGSVSMTNVSVFQNSATRGGVIYNTGVGRTKVTHGTLVQNSATTGGGVYTTNKRLVTLGYTLLQNPAGGNCALGAPGASVKSAGYNRSTDDTCGLTLATDQQNVANLKLGSLTDDGTPAGARFPLLAGNPAIDKGSPDGTTTDEIGQLRMGIADIGAIEYPRFVIGSWTGSNTIAAQDFANSRSPHPCSRGKKRAEFL